MAVGSIVDYLKGKGQDSHASAGCQQEQLEQKGFHFDSLLFPSGDVSPEKRLASFAILWHNKG